MPPEIRVLYVDDEHDLLELGKLFLEESGNFSVVTIDSALAALKLLRQEPFDAVISDYQMPDMDGIRFLADVRKYHGNIPFILFTGKGREEVVIQAINSGADFYLQKGGEPSAQFAELSHKIRIAVQRLQSETAITAAREKYRVLFETITDAVFLADRTGRFLDANRAACLQLGYEKEELLRLRVQDVSVRSEDGLREIIRSVEQKKSVSYETVHRHRNGGLVPVDLTVTLMEYGGERVFLGVAHDITGRKRSEGALQESEQRFRSIIQNSSDIIRIINADGLIVFDSPSSSRILGYPESFTIGKSPLGFIHPDDRERIREALDEVYNERNPGTPTEFRIRKADGSYIFVETVAANLLKVHGVMGIVTTTRPIDQRRRAEIALRESEEKNRTIISSIQTGIILQERSGKIILWNPEAERIFGLKAEEVIGETSISRTWSTLREDGSEMPGSEHPSMHTLATGEPCRNVVVGVRNTAGRLYWITINTSPLFGETEKEPSGVLISFLDITERKQTEDALRIQHDLSIELNRCPDLDSALNRILSAALQIEDLDAGGIYIADPVRGDLDLVAHKGLSPDFIAKITHYDADAPQVLTAKSGQPQYGTYAAIRPVSDPEREKERLRAFALIPVIHEGNLIAVMNLASHTVDEIPLSSRNTLETLAMQVGSILASIRSRQVLQDSEKRFRSLFDNIQDPVMVLGFDGGVRLANNAAFRLAGVRAVPGGGPFNLAPFLLPEWQERALKDLDRIRVEGGPLISEYQMRDAQGVSKWVEAMGIRAPWMGEECDLVTLRDVTERKIAEEALRTSESRFRAIFDSTFQFIALLRPGGEILEVNTSALKFGGVNLNEVVNQPFWKGRWWTVSKDVQEELKATIERVATGEFARYEVDILGKDDQIVTIDFSLKPVLDTAGTVIFLVAEGRDITKRREAEEALMGVNKKLKLLSGITRHDILNNVTVMLGFLEIARELSSHPEMERFITRLETKTREIRSQIQFTQVYEGIGSERPKWQDLCQVLANLQVPPGVTFSNNCTGYEVFADKLLEKVFSNLLDNSLRHGQHVTIIQVSPYESDAGLTITWEDNGAGVPAGEKQRIFERGFGKNTGLGLFLVREILDITGILILETGEIGKGARFEIMVPTGKYRLREGYDERK